MSNLHQAQSHDVLRSWQSQRHDINHHKDFVLPLFIGNDDESKEPIESMPDVYRFGCNRVIEFLEPLVYSFGLRAVLLFPVVTKLDVCKFNIDSDDNDDDDDHEYRSKDASSVNSSNSMQSSDSPSSSSDEEDRDRRDSSNVPSERLLAADESASNSQNPFLNQMDADEEHLLGESDRAMGEDQQQPLVTPTDGPTIGPTVKRNHPSESIDRKFKQSLDIKLVRGLALKDKYNPVLRLIPRLREKFPQLLIICDVCLCAFTSTGHCCLFDGDDKARPYNHHENSPRPKSNEPTIGFRSHHLPSGSLVNPFPISNNVTCRYLAMLSVEYAIRGCNVVAPSDMMDGRIQTIRQRLDENHLSHVSILSYSAKFASAFYGPFRQATNNAPEFGDRRAYQLPPGSRAMALKAVQRDIDQGADFIMVKPGCPYLDIVRDIRQMQPHIPIAIYQVSGEYSMLKLAAQSNLLDLKLAVNEVLTSFRRAGATIIISYFTPELLRGEL